MRLPANTWVMFLAFAVPGLRAQEPSPAEAYGIYRAPEAPADSAAAGGVVADSLVEDGAAVDTATADSAADTLRLDRVEESADDTSLTARMDVWRGGGLRREEFPDLRESAALTGRYTVFLDLVRRDPWGAALGDTARITLLAPTDSAFAALPAEAVDRLRADSAARRRWIEGLVLAGDRSIRGLLQAGEVETVGGTPVRMTRGPDGIPRAGETRVVQPDLTARNGMLHGVDRVTLPDSTAAEATSADP